MDSNQAFTIISPFVSRFLHSRNGSNLFWLSTIHAIEAADSEMNAIVEPTNQARSEVG